MSLCFVCCVVDSLQIRFLVKSQVQATNDRHLWCRCGVVLFFVVDFNEIIYLCLRPYILLLMSNRALRWKSCRRLQLIVLIIFLFRDIFHLFLSLVKLEQLLPDFSLLRSQFIDFVVFRIIAAARRVNTICVCQVVRLARILIAQGSRFHGVAFCLLISFFRRWYEEVYVWCQHSVINRANAVEQIICMLSQKVYPSLVEI